MSSPGMYRKAELKHGSGNANLPIGGRSMTGREKWQRL